MPTIRARVELRETAEGTRMTVTSRFATLEQMEQLVAMGMAEGTLTLLHHPTGQNHTRTADWVVLAVPPRPVEWLYLDLKAAGVSVERSGDCLAPRRAHAAVIDGERVGAAV